MQANHDEEDGAVTTEIDVIPNPTFITDARGREPPFSDDTPLFDPVPVSIPLDEIIGAADQYAAGLFPSLNDGKQQVVRPPEGYDREAGYDDAWVPVTWGGYSDVTGEATVGEAYEDTGTHVKIDVEDGIPNGKYTVWVVKFAALAEDSDLGSDDAFVTPAGNGLVGFQNLGQKFGGAGDTENVFTLDEDGDGEIQSMNQNGELTGIPGYREPVYPFVGETSDYQQSEERLSRIAADLREEDEIHFVGAYHYDDHTWGVYPGPWHVNHFDAVFRF